MDILSTLTDIRVLHLDQTQITDMGLVHLTGLTQLEELSLQGTRITNNGLAAFRDLRNIRNLNLDNTRVTSDALTYLRRISSLERVTMLGLDLNSQDLADSQLVTRKLEFMSRSNTVSDPRLLNEIIRAWKERRAAVRSFAFTCLGLETERGVSFPTSQELVVDGKGRIRSSCKGKKVRGETKVTLRDHERVAVFDGNVRTNFYPSSASGYPVARISQRSIDWWNYVRFFPLGLAYRPLQKADGGVISEDSLALTRDVETIDGQECILLYHSEGMVWVSSSHDYLPIRYSRIRRGVTRSNVQLTYEKENDNGWLLSSWDMSVFKQDGTCTHRYQVKVDEHRVNRPIADNVFEIAYPPGTLFSDKVRNETYILRNDGTRIPVLPGDHKNNYLESLGEVQ